MFHSIIFLAFLISLSSALPGTTQRKILIVSKLNTFSSLTFDPHPGAIKPHESVIRSPFLSPASVSLPRVHALLQFILVSLSLIAVSPPYLLPVFRAVSPFFPVLASLIIVKRPRILPPLFLPPPRTIADENAFVPVARVPTTIRSLEKQHERRKHERKCIS